MSRKDVDGMRACAAPGPEHGAPDNYFDLFGVSSSSESSPSLPSRKRDGVFSLIGGMGDDEGADAMPDAAANPVPMTRAEIRAELAKIFRVPRVSDVDLIDDYLEGGPAAIAALCAPLDEWPAFGERDLRVGPDDLRAVTTIDELVGVIDRALRRAAR